MNQRLSSFLGGRFLYGVCVLPHCHYNHGQLKMALFIQDAFSNTVK
jgi:hypothetical protein